MFPCCSLLFACRAVFSVKAEVKIKRCVKVGHTGSETIDSLHHERLRTVARLSADALHNIVAGCVRLAAARVHAALLRCVSGLMLTVSDLG